MRKTAQKTVPSIETDGDTRLGKKSVSYDIIRSKNAIKTIFKKRFLGEHPSLNCRKMIGYHLTREKIIYEYPENMTTLTNI